MISDNNLSDVRYICIFYYLLCKYLFVLNTFSFKFESVCELNKLPSLHSLRIQNNPMLNGMSVSNYTLQIIARIANLTVNYKILF